LLKNLIGLYAPLASGFGLKEAILWRRDDERLLVLRKLALCIKAALCLVDDHSITFGCRSMSYSSA
jgi:hypothetical protein